LFFLTFVQEDAAIIAACFSNAEYGLPVSLGFISVYLGIITGDLCIYGLGRVANRSSWLRSKVIGVRVDQVKAWLENNFVWAVAVCRVTPTLLFPTYIAIGWFRMPIKRFMLVTLVTSAIYVPIVFLIVTMLGDVVLHKLGYWSWVILLLMVVLFPLRKRFFSFSTAGSSTETVELNLSYLNTSNIQENEVQRSRHRGMPSLVDLKKLSSFAERLPNVIIYAPVGIRWLFLSVRYRSFTLPTLANPLIETGGYWGESKTLALNDIGTDQKQWVANYFSFMRTEKAAKVDLQEILFKMEKSGLRFPMVIKPDIGWQGCGVRKIDHEDSLLEYLSDFPQNAGLLVQEFISYDGEAGIFYVRMPGEPKGRVCSVTLRYFPYVIGDGVSTLHELIRNNPRTGFKSGYFLGKNPGHIGVCRERLEGIPAEDEMVRLAFIGSIRIGGIYRDARHLITPELSERFDVIAQSIPEFYYGRFDVRFKSTDLLKNAEYFSIIEVNGAGSEPINAWDPEVSFLNLYRELFKAQSLLFRVAAENRKRGFKPDGLIKFIKAARKQTKLIKQYPPAG
jgi:membrane protein DedA with SNARE-associated domain